MGYLKAINLREWIYILYILGIWTNKKISTTNKKEPYKDEEDEKVKQRRKSEITMGF